MRLTLQTDYGCRILIYLAVMDGEWVSAGDIANAYKIPLNHVKKIITHLVKGGYILSLRGRNGGVKIAYPAEKIRLGTLIQYLDQSGNLLRCLDEETSFQEREVFCLLAGGCGLKPLLNNAKAAFIDKMNQSTLKEIIGSCERKLLRGNGVR